VYLKHVHTTPIICYSIIQVSWKLNDQSLPSNVEVDNSNSINIKRVKKNNAGLYECEGINYNFQHFIAQSTVNIVSKLLNEPI